MSSNRQRTHQFVAAFQIGAAALAATSAPSFGQSDPKSVSTTTATKPVPALVPFSVQFDITSAKTGRTYRIYVSKPVVPAPSSGYGALYVLDGDTAFATAANQAVLASVLEGRKPLVVVGIGYPDTMAGIQLRTRDLTPYLPIVGADVEGPVKSEDWGGADRFNKFMLEELRPVIDRLAPIDKNDQSLMGYSLGGLFTLHVLLKHPESYRNYMVGSPAIFYTGKKVLEDMPSFIKKVEKGEVSPRILISSAELEQSTDPRALPERSKMVDNAREVANTLRKVKGLKGYRVDYTVFAGETHNGGIPAATSRGVAFVESAGDPVRK